VREGRAGDSGNAGGLTKLGKMYDRIGFYDGDFEKGRRKGKGVMGNKGVCHKSVPLHPLRSSRSCSLPIHSPFLPSLLLTYIHLRIVLLTKDNGRMTCDQVSNPTSEF
jgi:hypothetical protein